MANELLVGTGTGAASGAMMGAPLGPWGALAGGLIGGGAGALGGLGQRKANKSAASALEQQQAAIRTELAARNQDVGAVRAKFGDVWSLGEAPKFQEWGGTGGSADGSGRGAAIGAGIGAAASMGMGASLGAGIGASLGGKGKKAVAYGNNQAEIDAYAKQKQATLQSHGDLAGGIEGEAAATRDAGMQQLTGAGQQAAVAQRGATLSRGLLGSSLDESARQSLLAQYAGGRAAVAGATEGARQGGWDDLKTQQLNLEDKALGGQRMGGMLQSMQQSSQIAGARAQLPYTTFGNLLNTGLGLARQGAIAGEQGAQGFGAFMPRLTGTSGKTQGGVTTRGT